MQLAHAYKLSNKYCCQPLQLLSIDAAVKRYSWHSLQQPTDAAVSRL
jgi:hypothetical protein